MPEQPADKKELTLGAKLIRYGGLLFIIVAACVGLINFVYSMTKEKILAAQKEKMMKGVRAIFNLVPKNPNDKEEVEKIKKEAEKIRKRINVEYGKNRKTTFYDYEGKVACVVKPGGYDGPITMIVGYSPAEDLVLGIYIVSHTETPGFGARLTEKKQGKSLIGRVIGEDVSPPTALDNQTDMLVFQQPYYNKPASVFGPGDIANCQEVDGITSATISSQAVYTGVREAIAILKRYDPEKGVVK
jgi:electron transport complex protein RnfG